nr:MAG TPA: hypothetical protein [Caudoviricetes sp.]
MGHNAQKNDIESSKVNKSAQKSIFHLTSPL